MRLVRVSDAISFVFFDMNISYREIVYLNVASRRVDGLSVSVVRLKRTRDSRVMKSGASFPRYLYSLAFVVYFWLKVGYQVYLRLFNFSLVS